LTGTGYGFVKTHGNLLKHILNTLLDTLLYKIYNNEGRGSLIVSKMKRTAQQGGEYLLAVLKIGRTTQQGSGYLLVASKTGIMMQRGGGYLLVVVKQE
jgi:hypothetical protein